MSAGTLGAVRLGSHLEQLEALHAAVAEAIEAERERVRLGTPTRVLTVVRPRVIMPAPRVIRAWAIEHGHMPAHQTTGPIPADVVDAYRREVLSCES